MKPKGPLFLARQGYRRRRLRDAARLLPALGLFLFLLPMLWSDSSARSTGSDGIYFFVIWAALIVAAAVLGRLLRPEEED